jgi:cell division protein FtsL
MALRTKIEAALAAVILVAGLVFLAGYIREREQKAAFEAKAQVLESSIKDSQARVDSLEKSMKEQLAALDAKKQQLIQQPQMAPQIIREYIPTSTPIQQTAPITKDTLPDAPVATLTRQNETDLAQFGLQCNACETERNTLKAQVIEKDKAILAQKTEIAAAKVAIKGGTKKSRFLKTLKLVGCAAAGGAAGAYTKAPQAAAIGAGAGVALCATL